MSDHRPDEIDQLWVAHRSYLISVAFRLLGNINDAEDMVQEAFARLLPADLAEIDDVRGWLVVVVSRLCLDQLRSARSRRESLPSAPDDDVLDTFAPSADPADRVTLDDTVSMALLVVMEQLSPPERAVFVLHDVFQFSFEVVASIVGRTPVACRQIASRARRRIEAATGPGRFTVDAAAQQQVAERFIAACSGGDMEALMQLLHADVVGGVDFGPGLSVGPFAGRDRVSRNLLTFVGPNSGRTLIPQPVNGRAGVLLFRDRTLEMLLTLEVRDGVIVDIHGIGDPRKLALVKVRVEA